jgi:hypothetical protein
MNYGAYDWDGLLSVAILIACIALEGAAALWIHRRWEHRKFKKWRGLR